MAGQRNSRSVDNMGEVHSRKILLDEAPAELLLHESCRCNAAESTAESCNVEEHFGEWHAQLILPETGEVVAFVFSPLCFIRDINVRWICDHCVIPTFTEKAV